MWEPLIGSLGTLIGVLVTYLTFVRGRDKELRKEASETATDRSTLKHIGSNVDDIKTIVKLDGERLNDIITKVAINDESTKSAHTELTKVNERMNTQARKIRNVEKELEKYVKKEDNLK